MVVKTETDNHSHLKSYLVGLSVLYIRYLLLLQYDDGCINQRGFSCNCLCSTPLSRQAGSGMGT